MSGPGIRNDCQIWVTLPPIEAVINVPLLVNRLDGRPFVILRGTNGAGKTTLLKALIGLEEFAGSKLITRSNESFTPGEDRSLIRYLPQDPDDALFSNMSVADNIRLLAELLGVPADFAKAHQINCNLPAHRLSLGQKKLLLVEAILLSLPKPGVCPFVFVLLDEPFAGLDPINSKIVCDRLNAAATSYDSSPNVTFVVIDHDDIKPDGVYDSESFDVRTGVSFEITYAERIAPR